MFKRLALASALVLTIAAWASASEWTVDKAHSSIGFTVSHMVISKVPGKFTDFDGNVTFDPAHPADGSVSFTIQAASISTDNEKRDSHLKSADFFDVEKYPEITFVSTKVEPGNDNHYQITGDLTMRGVTKPVTFDAVLNGVVDDPWGNTKSGFTATTTINRQDFGVNWSKTLDTGGLVAGNDVDITVELELTETKAKS